MTARYVARASHFGRTVEEISCADFAEALVEALRLSKKRPWLQVEPMNLDGIDWGCPSGLDPDESEAWLEVAP